MKLKEAVNTINSQNDETGKLRCENRKCNNESLIVNPDENQSDIDSSINEKDSVNEETAQEIPDSTTKDSKTVDEIKSVIKEEQIDKQDNVSGKDDSKTNKSAEKTNSTAENAASETSSATKQKSGGCKGIAVKEEKDSGKRSIILISNDSVKRVAASSKILWVSGLAEKTRANDLKALFSKYGKVSGAKIVTNAKTPGTRCYGFITMASSEEALVCIEKLNHTELHGRIITVEKTTREPSGSIKRADLKSMQSKAPQKKSEKTAESSEVKKATEETSEKNEKAESTKCEKPKSEKSKSEKKTPEKPKSEKKTETAHIDEKSKDGTESVKEDGAEHKKEKKRTPSKERERARDKSRDRKRLRERRSRSGERVEFHGGFVRRGYGRGFGFRPYVPRSNLIDRRRRLTPPHRERDRDRDDRRRYSDIIRQREIERKNKEESLRLEREKQRSERERLKREKAELRKRTQMTLDDRRSSKRPFDSPRKNLDFWDDRKRGRREPSLDPSDSFGDYGRIIELYPSKDNVVRVAKVKTASGILVRPLKKLCPLEVCDGQESRDDPPLQDCVTSRRGRIVRPPERLQVA